MKGVTKEGLMGWEKDWARYQYPSWAEKLILAYRLLRRAERPGEAEAVRECGNRLAMAELRIEELERKLAEGAKAQPWEEFVAPFAKMDREQLEEWIGEFREGVADARRRLEEIRAIERGGKASSTG